SFHFVKNAGFGSNVLVRNGTAGWPIWISVFSASSSRFSALMDPTHDDTLFPLYIGSGGARVSRLRRTSQSDTNKTQPIASNGTTRRFLTDVTHCSGLASPSSLILCLIG